MNRRIDRSLTADWPVLDRSQWEKGVAPKDLFESGGAGADWSEHSRRKTACGYSRWLSWLSTQGLFDLDSSPPIASPKSASRPTSLTCASNAYPIRSMSRAGAL